MRAIVNATVMSVSSQPLPRSTVLFDRTGIRAVGRDLPIHEGTEIIDGEGKFLTPGLIDAHTHIGVSCAGAPAEFYDHNDRTNSVQPELRIIDALFPGDSVFREARESGVTTVQVLPGSANVIGGQGAIVRTWGSVADKMVIKFPSSLKGALGENPIRNYKNKAILPSTRMGSAAAIRKAFAEAQNYRMDQEERSRKGLPPKRDLANETLVRVLDGEVPFSVHCHRADDIATAIRIAEEFGLRYTLEHCTEGHLIADYLGEKKASAAIGPLMGTRRKMELANRSWDLVVALDRAGVHFCIITDHPVIPIQHLVLSAVMAVKKGVSRNSALRAITLSAAEHLGIDDRFGSIEAGKSSDLVLWNDDPMNFGADVLMTIIDGETVYSTE